MRGYLGNQGRNRPNKGPRHGNRDGNRGNGNGGRPDDMMHEPEMFDADDAEIISPAELTQSRASMNLTELKSRPIHELVKLAESMGLENLARSRKQDIIFSILKAHARNGENIYGDGVLEMQPGSGRLLLVDDVLATGGTLKATALLAERAGYTVFQSIVLLDLRLDPPFRWERQPVRAALRD